MPLSGPRVKLVGCTSVLNHRSKAVVPVLVNHFNIAVTSLGEERTNFSAFRTFIRFALVWVCLFPLPRCLRKLRLMIVALPGLFSHIFFSIDLGWTMPNCTTTQRL